MLDSLFSWEAARITAAIILLPLLLMLLISVSTKR